ncbi:OST-HTH/LOTUS domain-containing protein [Leptothermofonsia sp. ETS-13]|uniref:NYN domain-containing protein n=1 Tax=Leptothermofonsia sp. ETS-13 TaxID=3035696 RepID=UPI003BA36D22
MDLLYTGNFDGFCVVSSDSDFTRLASRIRESGLIVYGFGERKTPESFISACDKFIYTEILGKPEDSSDLVLMDTKTEKKHKEASKGSFDPAIDAKNSQELKVTKELSTLLKDAYEAIDEDDGWVNLSELGGQLTKLSPSFDPRNYKHKKLSDLIQAVNMFEIKRTPKSIRIKLKV